MAVTAQIPSWSLARGASDLFPSDLHAGFRLTLEEVKRNTENIRAIQAKAESKSPLFSMRFAEIPRVRRCLGRLLAEAKLRKERADAPKGGLLSDSAAAVRKALLKTEIALGYPRDFQRVELLEQAARYLTWACSFAEAQWPSQVDSLENDFRDFWPGWNSYLTSFSAELQGIMELACWASAEEANAISKAVPLHSNQDRDRANNELLWIGGDRLIVQLALLKRCSELLGRTEIFRESTSAHDALRAIFEKERSDAGIEPRPVPATTFQQRNPESPLAKLPDFALALLMFESELRGLPLDQKTAYVNCLLFFARRGENADSIALRNFYQVSSILDLPVTERRRLVNVLFSAPDRRQAPPPIPRFTSELVRLSLFMNVLAIAERDITPDMEQYLSQLGEELRVFKTDAGKTDLMSALTAFLASDNARQLSEMFVELADAFGEGKVGRSLRITGVAGRGIHGMLSGSSSQADTEAPRYDITHAKSQLHEQVRRAIDATFGSLSRGTDTGSVFIKLREMRRSYDASLQDDMAYFEIRKGFEFASAKRRRLTILSAIERLLRTAAAT